MIISGKMWTLYAYDEANDSKALKNNTCTLPVHTLHTVILSILNLLYKIHRLLYKKLFLYANSFFLHRNFAMQYLSSKLESWMPIGQQLGIKYI